MISIGYMRGSTTRAEKAIFRAMKRKTATKKKVTKKATRRRTATTRRSKAKPSATVTAKDAENIRVLTENGTFRPDESAGSGDDVEGLEVTQHGFVEKLGELVGPDEIIEAGRRLGAIKRQRKVDLPALVQATIAAMSPIPGAETSAFVNYLSITGVPLVPSSFYDRFTGEFAALMRELAARSIQMVREVSPADRSLHEYGVLSEKFDDVQTADGSSFMLKRLAAGWAPSTSKKRPAGTNK